MTIKIKIIFHIFVLVSTFLATCNGQSQTPTLQDKYTHTCLLVFQTGKQKNRSN
jgi:hypothetical protein